MGVVVTLLQQTLDTRQAFVEIGGDCTRIAGGVTTLIQSSMQRDGDCSMPRRQPLPARNNDKLDCCCR